jgi:hypothetical protein
MAETSSRITLDGHNPDKVRLDAITAAENPCLYQSKDRVLQSMCYDQIHAKAKESLCLDLSLPKSTPVHLSSPPYFLPVL